MNSFGSLLTGISHFAILFLDSVFLIFHSLNISEKKGARMSKDIAEKRLEDYNDVFADIFNNLVFQGEKLLEEERLIPLPTEAFTRQMDGDLRQGNRDIRKADGEHGKYRLICGTENQTGHDNTMPQRVMGYEYAGYEEQISSIVEENRKNDNPAYSKRIHDDQRLVPIVTAVLYWGSRPWQGPLCLHDMLEFPEDKEEVIKPHVANYPMNLIDLSNVPKETRERMTSDFRLVLDYLACRNNPEEMKAFMADKERVICHPEEFLDTMSEVASDGRYKMIKEQMWTNTEIGEEEEVTMWKIEDEIENRGELLQMVHMIRKKYQKGKDVMQTAEDLEEDISVIQLIYDLFGRYPEEDDRYIVEQYQKL